MSPDCESEPENNITERGLREYLGRDDINFPTGGNPPYQRGTMFEGNDKCLYIEIDDDILPIGNDIRIGIPVGSSHRYYITKGLPEPASID